MLSRISFGHSGIVVVTRSIIGKNLLQQQASLARKALIPRVVRVIDPPNANNPKFEAIQRKLQPLPVVDSKYDESFFSDNEFNDAGDSKLQCNYVFDFNI